MGAIQNNFPSGPVHGRLGWSQGGGPSKFSPERQARPRDFAFKGRSPVREEVGSVFHLPCDARRLHGMHGAV